MAKTLNSKHLLALLPISLLAVLAFSFIPLAHAYGPGATWQIGFAGTGKDPIGGFGFWGWCTFSGDTSGSNGDCQAEQYQHGSVNVNCHTHFDASSWVAAPGFFASVGIPVNDFIITTGHVTFDSASSAAACLSVIFPTPSIDLSTGALTAPFDTALPAAPGHYNLNGFGGLTELQIQVTKTG